MSNDTLKKRRGFNRLRGNRGSKAPLLQIWTTIRFRIFLAAAAKQANQDLSAFSRQAIWERADGILNEKTKERLDRQATAEETTSLATASLATQGKTR